MENNAMRSFLSEHNIGMHKRYVEECRLKLSILAKSGYDISDKSFAQLLGTRSLGCAKTEILSFSSEIYYHEIYFSSFGKGGTATPFLKPRYTSTADLLYTLECEAMKLDGGFLLVYFDGKSIIIGDSLRRERIMRYGEPRLALDLAEHAYFFDYGFDKRSYVRAALAKFELSKLK